MMHLTLSLTIAACGTICLLLGIALGVGWEQQRQARRDAARAARRREMIEREERQLL